MNPSLNRVVVNDYSNEGGSLSITLKTFYRSRVRIQTRPEKYEEVARERDKTTTFECLITDMKRFSRIINFSIKVL